MRYIITGGCGFVGFNLINAICADPDNEIVVIDDLSTGTKKNYVCGVKYYYNSINDVAEKVIKEFQPDTIFHLAAVPRVPYSIEHPFETFNANVVSTICLLETIRKYSHQSRLIFSSSSSIYGGADTLPTPETEKSNPKSPYALQKWQSEEWISMYTSLYSIDACILRYFNVFGPHSRYGGAYTTVLGAWLYSIYVDKTVIPHLEGDGLQTRDFCYVDNVVQANILASQYSGKFKGEAFNIAQGDKHSLNDCKMLIEKISGTMLNLEMRPTRVGDVKHTLADISLAKKILGYNPSTNFEEQVKSMADWYKDEYAKEFTNKVQ
jgi:nucleoside-diphosphate-sugar epimerase